MIIMDSFLGQHNPSNYFALTHILHEDDRELSCILKNCLTAPTVPKEASESE